MARAAVLAEQYHYDEINLNIGCPSDRVQSGRFGACLMPVPNLVADCVRAMGEATTIPVTVKTRIGGDEHDDYDFLASFVEVVAAAGCEIFIVHARKAVLSGLSPKENREVPPLRYPTIYRLKRDFPELGIILNGGIDSPGSVGEHLRHVDGVMIGRKAYADPFFLAGLQRRFLDAGQQHLCQLPARAEIVRAMASYAERQLSQGVRLHHITRHMLGLYSGQPGARQWRRYISENARRRDAGPEVLLDSLSLFTLAA